MRCQVWSGIQGPLPARPNGGLPMTSKDRITLYYSPQTRATGARVLLEELGAPYDLHVLNMKAADILWGVAFSWTMMFGLVPRKDVFTAYAERITSRPAFQRITAADAEMAAQHAAACGG